jgi:hypothetical protein
VIVVEQFFAAVAFDLSIPGTLYFGCFGLQLAAVDEDSLGIVAAVDVVGDAA